MRAPSYGYYEKDPAGPGALRRAVVPILFFIVFFCAALCVQQVVTYGAMKVAGAQPALHVGAGPLLSSSDFSDQPLKVHAQWWWGPHVVAKKPPVGLGGLALLLAGPFVNLVFIGIIAANMKRGRNILHYVLLGANGAALFLTLALAALAG